MRGLNVQLACFTGHGIDVVRSRPRIFAGEVVKAGAIDFGYRRIGDHLHGCREQDYPLALPFLKSVDLAEGLVEGNFTKILLILIQVIDQRDVTCEPEAKVRNQPFDLVTGNYARRLLTLVQNLFSCPSVVALYVTKVRVDKCRPQLRVARCAGIGASPSGENNFLFVRGCGSVRLRGTGRGGLSHRLEGRKENE